MAAPDDSQPERRFLSLDRRTYLRLQAAGIIATGVGSAETDGTGFGEGGYGEGGFGGTTTDDSGNGNGGNGSPPDHANPRFSSTSSTRFSSASSADYDSDS